MWLRAVGEPRCGGRRAARVAQTGDVQRRHRLTGREARRQGAAANRCVARARGNRIERSPRFSHLVRGIREKGIGKNGIVNRNRNLTVTK